MAERGQRSGLALETLSDVWFVSDVYGKDFDGYGAIEARVMRPIHLAHAALAKSADDLVRAEACAGCEGQPTEFYDPLDSSTNR